MARESDVDGVEGHSTEELVHAMAAIVTEGINYKVTCGISIGWWMCARIAALCVRCVLQRVGARTIMQVPCGAGALSIEYRSVAASS